MEKELKKQEALKIRQAEKEDRVKRLKPKITNQTIYFFIYLFTKLNGHVSYIT